MNVIVKLFRRSSWIDDLEKFNYFQQRKTAFAGCHAHWSGQLNPEDDNKLGKEDVSSDLYEAKRKTLKETLLSSTHLQL